MESKNAATSHTMAFLSDGTSASSNPSSVSWTDLIIVFDQPIIVSNLRIHFEDGAAVIYAPIKIEPRFAIIKFEGGLANKVVDIEFEPLAK
jgi:hypothetical protein